MLCGVLIPSFADVDYYFQLNVAEFTNFTYSILTLLAYVCLFLSTMIYTRYLKDLEFWVCLQIAQGCALTGILMNLLFVLRFNLIIGIPDIIFVIFTSTITGTLAMAFSFLPTLVLFTKITPVNIEATIFAMLTGLYNLSNSVIGPLIGSFLCKWFAVTSDDLSNYYQLIIIQAICVCCSFFYIYLVPLKADIFRVQKMQADELEADKAALAKKEEDQETSSASDEKIEMGPEEPTASQALNL
jgi:hypothetical protein